MPIKAMSNIPRTTTNSMGWPVHTPAPYLPKGTTCRGWRSSFERATTTPKGWRRKVAYDFMKLFSFQCQESVLKHVALFLTKLLDEVVGLLSCAIAQGADLSWWSRAGRGGPLAPPGGDPLRRRGRGA